jgi:cytidylate kinase
VIIAIDGPSGAGKGTVARRVAQALGYRHIDTGAMYRATALRARQRGISLDDDAAVAAVAEAASFALDQERVSIDGDDVTTAIRTPEIDRAAASVARLPSVRRVLVARQREMGGGGNVVMEGRDIGTTVFPGADLKIYLDAEPAERARRRAIDPAHRSQDTTITAVATALEQRDANDRTRESSPLSAAPDAVHVDTTHMTVDRVVERVLALARSRLHR